MKLRSRRGLVSVMWLFFFAVGLVLSTALVPFLAAPAQADVSTTPCWSSHFCNTSCAADCQSQCTCASGDCECYMSTGHSVCGEIRNCRIGFNKESDTL